MAPQKTTALVLSLSPYGESSYLIDLFTESAGLVCGIARGIRRQGRQHVPVEQGMFVELLLYIRPGRNVQTLGSLAVAEFFPSVRGDLAKTALRDTACETALRGLPVLEPHPDLYACFHQFLTELDAGNVSATFPFLLWRFYLDFAGILGYRPDLARCGGCGRRLENEPAYLAVADGVVACEACGSGRGPATHIPAAALTFLRMPRFSAAAAPVSLEPAARRSVTVLWADYCQYHFEHRRRLRSLEFLTQLL